MCMLNFTFPLLLWIVDVYMKCYNLYLTSLIDCLFVENECKNELLILRAIFKNFHDLTLKEDI